MTILPDRSPETTYFSVADVRRLDAAAIDGAGIAGYTLMTRAAQAALELARARYPAARRWLFLCGGGNNAGDAYVMARLAAAEGVDVITLWLTDPQALGGDAATAYQDFQKAGLAAAPFDREAELHADLLIDGMLGSGLLRDVSGPYREAVDYANGSSAPVLALDIPTGLNGDTGAVMGAAVVADATVTFVGLKSGLVLGDGPDFCGTISYADLAIPESCHAGINGRFRRLPEAVLAAAFPARGRDAHKGRYGHVVIVGGAPGMPGAVRIAGEAALRSGAGLVSVATHPVHSAQLNVGRPELMVKGVQTAADLEPLLKKASVVAVGPGLGVDAWGETMFAAAVASGKPLVVDADALNILAGDPGSLSGAVLTPHPGEAAGLLGVSTAEIQADRLEALAELVRRYSATVILKGAGSLVSSASGLPWICTAGNPGMASAGMGDALTGVVASLRGQGLSEEAAAAIGTCVHARAGDAAALDGERGLLASDLLHALRDQVNP